MMRFCHMSGFNVVCLTEEKRKCLCTEFVLDCWSHISLVFMQAIDEQMCFIRYHMLSTRLNQNYSICILSKEKATNSLNFKLKSRLLESLCIFLCFFFLSLHIYHGKMPRILYNPRIFCSSLMLFVFSIYDFSIFNVFEKRKTKYCSHFCRRVCFLCNLSKASKYLGVKKKKKTTKKKPITLAMRIKSHLCTYAEAQAITW